MSPLINQLLTAEGVPFLLLFLQVRLEPLQNPSPALCLSPGELLAARTPHTSCLLPLPLAAASPSAQPLLQPCWGVPGLSHTFPCSGQKHSLLSVKVKPVPSSFLTLCLGTSAACRCWKVSATLLQCHKGHLDAVAGIKEHFRAEATPPGALE